MKTNQATATIETEEIVNKVDSILNDEVASETSTSIRRRPKKLIIDTINFEKIYDHACSEAYHNKKFIGINGNPGLGKTTTFREFAKNHDFVFLVTAQRSMTAKQFYADVMKVIEAEFRRVYEKKIVMKEDDDIEPPDSYEERRLSSIIHKAEQDLRFINHSGASLHSILNKIQENLNNVSGLLTIDEGGKLETPRMLEYLHQLRDSTEETTGIIIAGPNYFHERLLKWVNSGQAGIPEIYSRINFWIKLHPPKAHEITDICHAYGILDKSVINYLKSECRDFRRLNHLIIEHLSTLDN